MTCSFSRQRNSPTIWWGCFFILASALDVEILVHDLLDGLVVVGDVGVAVDGVLDDGEWSEDRRNLGVQRCVSVIFFVVLVP